MTRSIRALTVVAALLAGLSMNSTGFGKTVGLWTVSPRYATAAITNTLSAAGWTVVTLGNADLDEGAKLAGLDVIFMPGGWDVYGLAGFKARRNLVRFVAGGKGLLDSAVVTSRRPLFPQVGISDGYGNGQAFSPVGENDLAKAMGAAYPLSDPVYLKAKPGPAGEVFAATNQTPVGLCGPAYGGRYVLFGGSFCRMDAGKPSLPAPKLLLACLEWLASAPPRSASETEANRAMADLDFLRQEKKSDWTRNESLWNGSISRVPEMHLRLRRVLEKRMFALGELNRVLSGETQARGRALTNELQQAMNRLDARYREVRAETDARIEKLEAAELTADQPVLSREAVSEQMLPQAQMDDLTARFDKAIAELRGALPVMPAIMPGTVEERLRNDPLMAPYYTGAIIPTPQQVEYRDEFVPMGHVAIVVGKDVENPGPLVDVLVERIVRYGGQAAVVRSPGVAHTAVVSLGDTKEARSVHGLPAVPQRDEGYILHAAKNGDKPLFVLKGHDRLGTLWSIASLMQMIHWKDGRTLARAVSVADYPRLKKRGLILTGSDFFHPARNRNGTILSHPNTELRLRQNRLLMLVGKFNEPCYQKLIEADCYSRDWKHPDLMPPDAHIEEDLAAMGRNLTPLGISWWAGIRPHAAGASSPDELAHKLSADEASVRALTYYARQAEQAGGHLAILLDDIRFPITPYDQERLGTAREVDTFVVTSVLARVKKDYPKARLLVCPPFYWGPGGSGWRSYGEDREEYLRMIGDRWPLEVDVFWSGRQVNATTLATREHYEWWSGLTKRKPYRWQNCAAYWCHLARRHYPTDPLDSLWQNDWDGQFDVLGWYGFNGGDIPRYCVTDTLSGDFQWNPEAYGKEKKASALRSIRETAEKFIGAGSWPLLVAVTTPLSAFDEFYTGETRDPAKRRAIDQAAARAYDTLNARRNETMAALKALEARYPAGLKHWSALESFAGWANGVDRFKPGKP